VNQVCSRINAAFESAEEVLPTLPRQQHKPWIGNATLNLIDRKRSAALVGSLGEVKALKNRSRSLLDGTDEIGLLRLLVLVLGMPHASCGLQRNTRRVD